jgi:NAD(P)-dependent dehydrogenase (short-subunit alcohol dehydrogenase family)
MSTSTQSETCKFTLKAKVVVITGCTGILGSAYTRMFAAEGAQLVIADLAEQNPTLRAQQIRDEFGVKCVGVACDVGSEADVRALFQVARVEYGRADVVLNNAAATGEHLMNLGRVFAPFEEYPLVIWEQVLRTNLTCAGEPGCSAAVPKDTISDSTKA